MIKPNVLLLCTGNACRSQMADGLVRSSLGDHIDVFSAGIHPSGVHPKAARVLEELGIDTSPLYSKHVDDLGHIRFDLLVTLCDHASESCPVIPNAEKRVHMPFLDPIYAIGTEEEVVGEFRKVRDEIESRLIPYLRAFFNIDDTTG